jgi:hypothetical protein
MPFAYLAASAEDRLDQLRHAVTHLGSVDLSIDAAQRVRKRIAVRSLLPQIAEVNR